ncbi:MFS transporter [Chloroflexota bacterium]
MKPIPGLNKQGFWFLAHSGLLYLGLFGVTDVLLNFFFISLGYDNATIGFLQGLPRLGGLLTGIPLGIYASRIGSRRITVYATLGLAVSYSMVVLWPTLTMLAASRFLVGLFYGATQIAASPLMMGLASRTYQTHLFSYHSVVTMVSTSAGSLIAGYLPALVVLVYVPAQVVESAPVVTQSAYAYSGALLIVGVIIALSAVPLGRLVDDRPHAPPDLPTAEAPPQPVELPLRQVPWGHLSLLSLPFLLFGFTGGLTFPFYNMFFRQTYGLSDEVVGFILSLGWLGMGLVTLTNPWWDKRFGRAVALGIVMTLAAVAFLMLGAAQTLFFSVVAFVLGISIRNMMSPLFQPLLMESVPANLQNIISSVSFVIWNIGYMAATLLAGSWLDTRGFAFIYSVVAVGVFLTGLVVYLIFRNRTPYSEPDPALQGG